jgi:site-specific recombinase XerD
MAQELIIINKTGILSTAGTGITLPAFFATDHKTAKRVIEFFTANIRNPNTRRAYAKAAGDFAGWCEQRGLDHLRHVQPIHVAAYIEDLQQRIAAPSVKVQLAAIRMLFDWLVLGQIVPTNPASVVRGPKHVVKKGKTPILSADEARTLLKSIDTEYAHGWPLIVGLRDRALIALLTYTFSRVGAAVKMRVEDVYTEARKTWVRLHEKNSKRHEMPCHHNLKTFLEEYIEVAEIADDPKGWLFRTTEGQSGVLTDRPMSQVDVYRMIRRRAADAGIETKIGCHTFRATGITEYLRNGGKLEIAQQMANHESARTTGLYDRRDDQLTLDEVERILI